jgi:hypothetical protein
MDNTIAFHTISGYNIQIRDQNGNILFCIVGEEVVSCTGSSITVKNSGRLITYNSQGSVTNIY